MNQWVTRIGNDGNDVNDGNNGNDGNDDNDVGIFLFPINILVAQTELPPFFQVTLLFKVVVAKSMKSFDISIHLYLYTF